MNARRCLLIVVFLIPLVGAGQDTGIESVNFRKLRKEIKKKNSAHYYPVLFKRYLDLDTSLTAEDFRYLYYGFTFQDNYRPYGEPLLRDSLISYLQREDPLPEEVALSARIAGDLLRESPFRLRETFIAAVAYEMAGDAPRSKIYYHFFERQVEAIMSSGDGLDKETAFTVIYIPDEYEILEVLGFSFTSQELVDNRYDLLRIVPNPYGVTGIYFDAGRMIEAGLR